MEINFSKLYDNVNRSLGVCEQTLYIVPTPIGNLKDITYRALLVLNQVNYIIAENFYRAKTLLNFFSIQKPVYVMNRYNESEKTKMLIKKLKEERSNMALISDAGTPLMSDPGYRLVRCCYNSEIKVVSLPGPCAAIAALCGSGLPVNRFCFEGFLPSKRSLRISKLRSLLEESRTLIFYDVKYRVLESLRDMVDVFGVERYVVMVRELSKIWESIFGAPVGRLLSWAQQDRSRTRGEIVLVVSGNNSMQQNLRLSAKVLYTMKLLSSELSLKKASILTGNIYGIKKNMLYKMFMRNKN